jgi:hypothetical protein
MRIIEICGVWEGTRWNVRQEHCTPRNTYQISNFISIRSLIAKILKTTKVL